MKNTPRIVALVVLVLVNFFFYSAAAMDMPALSSRKWSARKVDQSITMSDTSFESEPTTPRSEAHAIQASPPTSFSNIPANAFNMIGQHLTAKESARLARVSKDYRNAVKGTSQSAEYNFGSPEAYVEDTRNCTWLEMYPNVQKTLQTIYVTVDVYTACGFSKQRYPSLKNIYVKSSEEMEDFLNKKIQDFEAMRDATLNETDPFALKYFSIGDDPNNSIEALSIQQKLGDWFLFLLDHRDWNILDDPFLFWNGLMNVAASRWHYEALIQLFEFQRTRILLIGGAPLKTEGWLFEDTLPELDTILRKYVDPTFISSLDAVEQGQVDQIKTWLELDPPSEYVNRVLAFSMKMDPSKIQQTPAILKISSLLLYSGKVDIHFRDTENATFLILACLNKEWEMADHLLDQGAEINVKNKDGRTPLIYAAKHGYWPIIERLLHAGATVNVQDTVIRKTALMYAAEHGHFGATMALLLEGAEIDLQDDNRRTALSYAAHKGHFNIVQQLLPRTKNMDTLLGGLKMARGLLMPFIRQAIRNRIHELK